MSRKMKVPNAWDAGIKLLYAADRDKNFAVDVLGPGDEFDVLADVEIGENFNENVDDHTVRVSIVNLSTATRIAYQELKQKLEPENNTPFLATLRVPFGALDGVNDGDVLQAIASYKVIARANSDVSTAFSETFVFDASKYEYDPKY